MKWLLLLIGLSFVSCEKENIICDTSYKSLYLYVKDTVEHIQVVDINNGYVLYSDSNLYSQFKVVDDSYLNVIGRNNQTTLNIKFRYVGDTVHLRVNPICIHTDDCHVNFYYPSDTL